MSEIRQSLEQVKVDADKLTLKRLKEDREAFAEMQAEEQTLIKRAQANAARALGLAPEAPAETDEGPADEGSDEESE